MIKLSESQFNEIVEAYWRGEHHQRATNGYDGWWGYFRGYNENPYGWLLHKVTVKITESNDEPNEEQRKEALRAELKRRLEDHSKPFIQGVEAYFADKIRDRQKSLHADIVALVTDERAELIDKLIELVEYPVINQLFQRIKDLDTEIADEAALRAQFDVPKPERKPTPKKPKRAKKQKLKTDEFGELKVDQSAQT
jgi:hypothetical protein